MISKTGLPIEDIREQMSIAKVVLNMNTLNVLLAAKGVLSQHFMELNIDQDMKLHVASQIANQTNVHLILPLVASLKIWDVFNLCQHGLAPGSRDDQIDQ